MGGSSAPGSPEFPGSSASPYATIGNGSSAGGGGSNGETVVNSGRKTKAVSTYVVGSSLTTETPAQFTGGSYKNNAGIWMLGAAMLGALAL